MRKVWLFLSSLAQTPQQERFPLHRNPYLCFSTTFPYISPSLCSSFPLLKENHTFPNHVKKSLYMTSAVAFSANSEFMWLYKWQTLPLDGMHSNFLYIYHRRRPSILLSVALSSTQADKAATAVHSAHLKLSPEHILCRSLCLSLCRRNKQSSMRTLWRSWGQSRTTLQWATMDRATLHSSGFVFTSLFGESRVYEYYYK